MYVPAGAETESSNRKKMPAGVDARDEAAFCSETAASCQALYAIITGLY
jgi:hypothetical protein